ncbi:MAG: hypothetical protein AMJ91_07980 [candidate division Zixibacteria bacterium SM23_73_3]|nr:MAG: hypothetical protein AMJ91_07980 [candidate division Zixibacteria bacterium SM23_73_3]
MQKYDLAIAWCWEYDADFVHQIDTECGRRGILSYLIHPHNLLETLQRMEKGELQFKIFFDRASDQEEDFDQLVDVMQEERVKMINDADRVVWAIDKATMHREFSLKGINVPKTMVFPPWDKCPEVRSIRLNRVGVPFVIKPACGGCGDGVVTNARTMEDIQQARQQFPEDKYLVQEKIEPVQLNGRRAWFRVFFAFGEILPCWWDDQTKIADVLSPSEIDKKIYSNIKSIMRKVSKISRLELFSTEIALTSQGKLVVVDHVNDQVDLRKKSSHFDGIPDEVVGGIVINLVNWVEKHLCRTSTRREPSPCKKI